MQVYKNLGHPVSASLKIKWDCSLFTLETQVIIFDSWEFGTGFGVNDQKGSRK